MSVDVSRELTSAGLSSLDTPIPPNGPAWPVLDPQALHGLPGRIVCDIAENSESDPAALLVTVLAMFGNAIGRGPGFEVEGDLHSTALYGVIVGQSSKARKGSSYGQVRSLYTLVDPDWTDNCIASGLSTGEGLIHAVRDPRSERRKAKTKAEKEQADEGGYIEEEVDPGIADKRLFAVQAEFAGMLKVMAREGNTLSPTIRDLWDHGRARTLTKGQPETATAAHVSILGHITSDELAKRLDETEIANGFANRFLFICAERKKLLPFGGKLPNAARQHYAAELRGVLEKTRGVDVLDLDPEAREAWATVYGELSAGDDGMLGAVTGRAEAQVRRLAVIYALIDGAPIVRLDHLRAALALWDYSRSSAAFVFAGSTGTRIGDRLLRALTEVGEAGLTRSAIRESVGHHAAAAEIDAALAVLEARGLAHHERVATGGRPAEHWYLGRKGRKAPLGEQTGVSSQPPPIPPTPAASAQNGSAGQYDPWEGR